MTDKAWAEGMAEFQKAGLPGWPYDDEDIAFDRGEVYRKYLDELSDGQWFHAVAEAIRNCKWFPTVHELMEFGESYRPAYKQLPEGMSLQERLDNRETAARGVELIREHCAKVGLVLPKSGPVLVEVSDERKRELVSMLETLK